MQTRKINMSISQIIKSFFFVFLIISAMGTTATVYAKDLLCMVSTSPSLPSESIINNVHITREGYIAATNLALLDQVINLAISGNRRELKKFLSENPFVFYLRANLWAHIEQRAWPGKVKIKLMDYDLSVWTVKEALD